MSNLNPVSQDNLRRAAVILDSASGRQHAPRTDYPPYIEEAAAGAALALENGHPHALRLARETKAEDWLDPNSIEGRHFHRAVARVLGGTEAGAIVDMSPKGMMQHIVTDTVNMTLANRMELAVKDRNPVMVQGMDAEQIDRVEAARANPRLAADISSESRGSYEAVSKDRRMALIDVFHTMEGVSDVAKAGIDQAAIDIQAMRADAVGRASLLRSSIADFKEDGVPLFREAMPDQDGRIDANWRAEELALRIGKGPMNELEAGVAAHVAVKGPQNRGFDDGMNHDARVAVMVDVTMMDEATAKRDPSLSSPHAIAMRIEGMSAMMREADNYGFSYTQATDNDVGKSLDMQLLSHSQPTSMSPDAQVRLFETLHNGDRVPALTAMKLHGALRDISSVDRSASVEQVQPVRQNHAHAHAAAQAADRGLAR